MWWLDCGKVNLSGLDFLSNSFSYAGRALTAVQYSQTLTFTHDALGREPSLGRSFGTQAE